MFVPPRSRVWACCAGAILHKIHLRQKHKWQSTQRQCKIGLYFISHNNGSCYRDTEDINASNDVSHFICFVLFISDISMYTKQTLFVLSVTTPSKTQVVIINHGVQRSNTCVSLRSLGRAMGFHAVVLSCIYPKNRMWHYPIWQGQFKSQHFPTKTLDTLEMSLHQQYLTITGNYDLPI